MPKDYQIVDVFGLDDDLLATLPEPLKAFILLFPVTKKVRCPVLISHYSLNFSAFPV